MLGWQPTPWLKAVRLIVEQHDETLRHGGPKAMKKQQ